MIHNNTHPGRKKTPRLMQGWLLFPGSAGCQPATVGSLPTGIVFDKLSKTTGKLPALPRMHAHCRAKERREILRVLRVLRG